MKTVIIIEKDYKTVREVRTWCEDMDFEVTVENFNQPQDFFEQYFASGKTADQGSKESKKKESEGDDNEGKPPQIDLVLVDMHALHIDPILWVQKCRQICKQRGYFPENSRTRFALLTFAEQDFDIEKLAHPFIDDLIIKPFDRTLVLQKIELLLTDNKNRSFLYNQKTNRMIEVAKNTNVTAVSDYDLVIKNRVALKAGTFIRLHAPLFEDPKSIVGNYMVVLRCHHSDQVSGSDFFACYFNFFGITTDQLRAVRKHLAPIKEFQRAVNRASEDKTIENLGAPHKVFILIDMDPNTLSTMEEIFQTRFNNITLYKFNSYNQFLGTARKEKEPEPGADSETPADAAPNEMDALNMGEEGGEKKEEEDPEKDVPFGYSNSFRFEVDIDTLNVTEIDPPPKKDTNIFGVSYKSILSNQEHWTQFISPKSKAMFSEFIEYLKSGQRGTIQIQLLAGNWTPHNVSIFGTPGAKSSGKVTDAVLVIETVRSDGEEENLETTIQNLKSIDSFILNGEFVRGDTSAWIEGFKLFIQENLSYVDPEAIPIFILGDEKGQINPDRFLDPTFYGFFTKPFDRRFVLQTLASNIEGLSYKKGDVIFERHSENLNAKIAQKVVMKEVSEYGLMVEYPSPLKENVFLTFFSSVFDETNRRGIIGKCYASQEGAADNSYQCFFTYFGVQDLFLKKIRAWIKGEYVTSKGSS